MRANHKDALTETLKRCKTQFNLELASKDIFREILTVAHKHNERRAVLLGTDIQGNEVYGGGDEAVGIFLHRSSDDAVVKGEDTSTTIEISSTAPMYLYYTQP